MTEVRSISSTGGEKGVKPERYSLLPRPALDELARLYNFGATKYAAHNWRRGYEWSKSFDSLMRHAVQFWDGETIDPETGCSNMAGVAFHAFALMTFQIEHPEFDDRPNTSVQPTLFDDVDVDRNEHRYVITDPDMPELDVSRWRPGLFDPAIHAANMKAFAKAIEESHPDITQYFTKETDNGQGI